MLTTCLRFSCLLGRLLVAIARIDRMGQTRPTEGTLFSAVALCDLLTHVTVYCYYAEGIAIGTYCS